MLMLSKQYMQIIGNSITDKPLAVGELRRVEGLGRRFLALKGTKVSKEYLQSMSFTFGKKDYILYTKLGDQQ